jgi:hypothetical protein
MDKTCKNSQRCKKVEGLRESLSLGDLCIHAGASDGMVRSGGVPPILWPCSTIAFCVTLGKLVYPQDLSLLFGKWEP